MKFLIHGFLIAFLLIGCSSSGGPDASYEKVGTVEHRVLSVREGGGAGLGGMIGSVMGSLAGNDALSSAVGVIAGGVAGAYVGAEASRHDASQLTVSFDEGGSVVTETRDLSIQIGDRVKVVKEPNQHPVVEKISY